MSGIYGCFGRDGQPTDSAMLRRMGERLARRGPDDAGVWQDGPVGLGHRALWTTPEAPGERQPVASQDGSLVVTADARLDHRTELQDRLGAFAPVAPAAGDATLILAAYARWGEACVTWLDGDFAFALWDAGRQRLVCARDPMGVKPFDFFLGPRRLVFASTVQAVLADAAVPRSLDEARIADHLSWSFEDQERTFYRDVHHLPPAHTLVVGVEEAHRRRYWSLEGIQELRLRSDAEYAEAFRAHFTAAVDQRLRAAGPVGSMLSGGLDSSSICCVARDRLAATGRGPLLTFSATWPTLRAVDGRADESRYAAAVVATGGMRAHEVRADAVSPLGAFLWDGDEPIPAPNLYMDWAVFHAAHQQGVRVILSGFDGDTVVSHGYEYLGELARTGRWSQLRREAKALAARSGGDARQLMWEFGFRPQVPASARSLWRWLRGRESAGDAWRAWRGQRVSWPPIVAAEFARGVKTTETARTRPAGPARSARAIHRAALESGLLLYALRLLDGVAAEQQLEPRYPFRDRRLMEFCLALPAAQKLQHGWPRAILRRAMEGVLPPAVQWRIGKANLGAHFRQRLLADHRETLEAILADPALAAYVDQATLRETFQRYVAQPLQADAAAMTLLNVVTLALWLQQEPPARVSETLLRTHR